MENCDYLMSGVLSHPISWMHVSLVRHVVSPDVLSWRRCQVSFCSRFSDF